MCRAWGEALGLPAGHLVQPRLHGGCMAPPGHLPVVVTMHRLLQHPQSAPQPVSPPRRPFQLRVGRVVVARQEPGLRWGAVSEVSGLLTAPPEPGGSPAHPKSPFAVTSHDLKLKQGSMNNVMRSFFSSCLQILRG